MPTDTSPTLKMNTSRVLPTRIRPDAFREKTPGAAGAPAVTASAIMPPALGGQMRWSVRQQYSEVNNLEEKALQYRLRQSVLDRYSNLAFHLGGSSAVSWTAAASGREGPAARQFRGRRSGYDLAL